MSKKHRPTTIFVAGVSILAILVGWWIGRINGIGVVGTILSGAGLVLSAFVLEEVLGLGTRLRRQIIRNECLDDLKSNVKNLRSTRNAKNSSKLRGVLHETKVILDKLQSLEPADTRVQWAIEQIEKLADVNETELATVAKDVASELDGRIKQLELICRESEYGAVDH